VNGVSIFRDMARAMPAVGLPVGLSENGRSASDSHTLGRFDVCPTWLELAIRHLSDAQVAQAARIVAWKGADENSKAGALEWEFEASMQSIMASSIALDAFCAAIQAIIQPSRPLADPRREKRHPRHAEISEVLRVAFSLTAKAANRLRQNLGEIFRFRELAIDSFAKSDAPILHPELRVGGEWRFVYFRCENARLIVSVTLRLIRELVASDKPKDADVQIYIDVLRPRLERLHDSNALNVDSAATGTQRHHVT
jgi:hypothetical protein